MVRHMRNAASAGESKDAPETSPRLQFSSGYSASAAGVEFYGWNGAELVICMITAEALTVWFGASADEAALAQAYIAHRDRIHEAAAKKHAAGAFDRGGRIFLHVSDGPAG